jgi:translation elongation factor aEF-1 beta
MGNVSVIIKVYPNDPSGIDELKTQISNELHPQDIKIEDIGFGVKILKVMFIVPDSEGGIIEEKVRSIQGVSQLEVESISLI